jgi:DNA-binding NtrC family response regulator
VTLRLLVIGTLNGPLAAAARIALDKGAPVIHADCIDAAMAVLRSGKPADLLMVDVAIDIRSLASRLQAAHSHVPIVACGAQSDAAAAVAAIHAGAKEYIPLPPDPDMIAAILAAVADDGHETPTCAPSRAGEGRARWEASAKVAHAALAAEAVTCALVGRTVADVERDLILETLRRCVGNRTRAAGILGISIRTLRNKLTGYAAEGIRVPPPNSGETNDGEMRGAA